jgi:hypothetical protein
LPEQIRFGWPHPKPKRRLNSVTRTNASVSLLVFEIGAQEREAIYFEFCGHRSRDWPALGHIWQRLYLAVPGRVRYAPRRAIEQQW